MIPAPSRSTGTAASPCKRSEASRRHAGDVDDHITPLEEQVFLRSTSQEISEEVAQRLTRPPRSFPDQRSVMAIHWHPEFVPMPVIRSRIDATFPQARERLIIPTQHNILMSFDDYAGVEMDCFAKEFGRKVQILLHFRAERVTGAKRLKSMLAFTFRYRASQLFDFLKTLTAPEAEEDRGHAAALTGATDEVMAFVRHQATKIEELIRRHRDKTPQAALRNKLVKAFFDGLREIYEDRLINLAQAYIREVKQMVKAAFSPEYFYEVPEIIEEVRLLGGGIIVPHPEQFWPILLAGYDVDGYEVWNPQSRLFTEFLIGVVNRQNRMPHRQGRPLLVTMGDDCHLGEKTKPAREQDPEKAAREVGVQPWDELALRKSLMRGSMSRERVIEEYRARLA